MSHNIPLPQVEKHSKSISDAKRSQVAALQNHIQEILENHHTFLQGSYKNDTSTSDINDVDIVAIRTGTYSGVHSGLAFSTKIPWEDIFSEIESKLKSQNLYQWTVVRRDKCIEVRTSTFKADIVPAVQILTDVKLDPISIYSFKKLNEKINHPRTHYENGVAKHSATNQKYKPAVRMFKNWRINHFGNQAPLSSYQIESLVYNCPNDKFSNDNAVSFILISSYILELLNQIIPIRSVCRGEDITSNWDVSKRKLFKNKLNEALLNASKAYRAPTVQEAQTYWDKAFNV